jgi:hypothetical protein
MPNLSKVENLKKNHNFAHGLLLQIQVIVKNHFRLKDSYPIEMNEFDRRIGDLFKTLSDRKFILTDIKAPFVPSVYIEILKKLLKNLGNHMYR